MLRDGLQSVHDAAHLGAKLLADALQLLQRVGVDECASGKGAVEVFNGLERAVVGDARGGDVADGGDELAW